MQGQSLTLIAVPNSFIFLSPDERWYWRQRRV